MCVRLLQRYFSACSRIITNMFRRRASQGQVILPLICYDSSLYTFHTSPLLCTCAPFSPFHIISFSFSSVVPVPAQTPSPPVHCWRCEWLRALGPSPPGLWDARRKRGVGGGLMTFMLFREGPSTRAKETYALVTQPTAMWPCSNVWTPVAQ